MSDSRCTVTSLDLDLEDGAYQKHGCYMSSLSERHAKARFCKQQRQVKKCVEPETLNVAQSP